MTDRRVLVTGGAGFIGVHLATRLAARAGTSLTLVDNLSRGRHDAEFAALLARPGVTFVEGDLTVPGLLDSIGTGFDEVYHLAAIVGVGNVLNQPYETLRTNALATLQVLDWLGRGGAARLLFASTSEAYAWTAGAMALPVPTPEDVPLALTDLAAPRSAYAGSKIFGELVVNQRCLALGVPFSIVRYHNVYGPRMGRDHVIPQLHARVLAGQSPLVVYSPTHRRAFCHVQDAVTATIAALQAATADGLTVNVGNDSAEVTIGELAGMILRLCGRPEVMVPAHAPHDTIVRRCPDLTRLRAVVGFEPTVDLGTGLRDTLAWYEAAGGGVRQPGTLVEDAR